MQVEILCRRVDAPQPRPRDREQRERDDDVRARTARGDCASSRRHASCQYDSDGRASVCVARVDVTGAKSPGAGCEFGTALIRAPRADR